MSNIDPTEIEKFNAIAARWWDLSGEFSPLHKMNPYRIKYIEDNVGGLFDKTVLDVGSGGGILAEALAQRGATVTGLEPAPQSVEVAIEHAQQSQLDIDYHQGVIEDFAIDRAETFDIVTCLEMLEHVPDPASILTAAISTLKPGGYLFVSTLNRSLRGYLLGILAAEYLLNIVPKGTHEHNKFLKPSEVIGMIEQNDCKVQKANGIHFNPITQNFSINNDLAVNYILCAKKL
ncbi:bifunctional 3-demethylubiquinone-9 3-methyltransferase/ 2-octaprenyl-6-hydroxy phenol methylase [Catenovulum agarivorans DS-2]|uniref:Ubiquinone biosynthesis O-methyltransferase n=1 Tax=Catenovulum agarivorans DS-2 TaxID=1328313 RepID=W7QA62_9ALTE|nr:bifunctional 2-polyprenyl-6-hydroxyphenol methylase/3-demethylubiquinol 3-O-methyltransferase UbiG [Catenovulum agarivorans]EWH08891.1 bifunctional 3-demethylubiquinone-9 3-methyltransferase/ 2-octaprenyl-6-hydroxy phenol methylase [Catenovulum agarivorans DS-2]